MSGPWPRRRGQTRRRGALGERQDLRKIAVQLGTQLVRGIRYELVGGVYTTNSIEALNAKLRRTVRARGHFPSDEDAVKLLPVQPEGLAAACVWT